MAINTYLSIITLNFNELNSPIKRHRVADDWIKKNTHTQELTTCCLQETHFRAKDTHRLKVRGWKIIFHVNGNKAVLISDKTDFKTKSIKKDKEEHYVMIKG